MFSVEILFFPGRIIKSPPNKASVVWMYSLKGRVQRGAGRWIVFKNAVGFLRPMELPAGNPQAKTAGLADLLTLSQESFAPLQIGIEACVLESKLRLAKPATAAR